MEGAGAVFDVVVAGGRVLDPGGGVDGVRDLGIRDGRIAAIAPALQRAGAGQVIDAAGRLVLPGLIDLHTHLWDGISILGVAADETCLPTGVTTAVDAGTAGWIGFPTFRRRWIDEQRTRVLAFVNISELGIIVDDGLELGERELRHVDVERTIEVIEAHRDVCLGVKVRVATNQTAPPRGERPLELALEIVERTGTRLMVHITEPGIPLERVFDRLRPGDIVTHAFHGRAETIVDADGHVLASARRARERGVVFDIGHGGGSFTFTTARAALADGFEPDTISTDLHTISIRGACRDLPTTMGKFVALGMPLERVVAAVTINAARAVEHPEVRGTLEVGSAADVAILDEIAGPSTFEDVNGDRIEGNCALRPWRTIRSGTLVESSAARL